MVLGRVYGKAVGSCGVVVDEDVIDARGSSTASRVVVDMSAKWGGGRGSGHWQRLLTLAALGGLLGLTLERVPSDSTGF